MSERRAARAAAAATPRGRRERPFLVALAATLAALSGVATVLAVIAAVFVGGLARSFDSRTDVITDAFPATDRPTPAGDAVDVLLVGSDSRAARGPDGDPAGTPPAGGRSDALVLAHVPADRRHVYLVSILRDSWVDVPGHGTAKINAAYSWGGIPLTVQTVERLLDVRIDHVAEIDFAGFEDMTDALGGITVQSGDDFTAQGYHFTKGPNHLDGARALAFVRDRYSFADADHTRVRNQQAFLRGVFRQAVSQGTLTDPRRLRDFVRATSEHLAVDPGLDAATVARLGWSLRGLRADDLVTCTMPTAGSGTSPDGQSYVVVDEHDRQSLSQALRSDDLQHWIDARPHP
ncbi:LytR family transcriptional regulator [Curtobacterium sp. MCSS17_008]|uniref:LCP family protein n=1 Tax=Curtobacterium sp. MCSS17_008 TaxID=2175647 RepID=UPI000DA80168|nr:LCP family protein [Curtobacterium sp. MCSS17_008]PZF55543.1 LytR family transcriptional regulator [Curtobacterium sp. MCSS17_008]